MIQTLCGGIGSVGLAGMLSDLAVDSVSAQGLGRYTGPKLPQKAKHVICLFMAGGPSQLDMFDYKPDLVKWAGQRHRRRRPAHRTIHRRHPAVAVQVFEAWPERHRRQRARAAARLGD